MLQPQLSVFLGSCRAPSSDELTGLQLAGLMVPMQNLCDIFKALYYRTIGKPLCSVCIMKYLV